MENLDGYWKTSRGSNDNPSNRTDSEQTSTNSPTRPNIGTSSSVIIGWRIWNLNDWNIELPYILESVVYNTVWYPMKPVTGVVGWAINTGIHAWKNKEQSIEYMNDFRYNDKFVYGEVSLWGRVIKFDNGYRASKAYPKSIYIPETFNKIGKLNIAKELRNIYGVDVE